MPVTMKQAILHPIITHQKHTIDKLVEEGLQRPPLITQYTCGAECTSVSGTGVWHKIAEIAKNTKSPEVRKYAQDALDKMPDELISGYMGDNYHTYMDAVRYGSEELGKRAVKGLGHHYCGGDHRTVAWVLRMLDVAIEVEKFEVAKCAIDELVGKWGRPDSTRSAERLSLDESLPEELRRYAKSLLEEMQKGK